MFTFSLIAMIAPCELRRQQDHSPQKLPLVPDQCPQLRMAAGFTSTPKIEELEQVHTLMVRKFRRKSGRYVQLVMLGNQGEN